MLTARLNWRSHFKSGSGAINKGTEPTRAKDDHPGFTPSLASQSQAHTWAGATDEPGVSSLTESCVAAPGTVKQTTEPAGWPKSGRQPENRPGERFRSQSPCVESVTAVGGDSCSRGEMTICLFTF